MAATKQIPRKQLAAYACIFADDEVGGFKEIERTQRDIA